MAAAIRTAVGVDSQLVRGSGGIFDISVDNELLFSKSVEGRFPTESEIIERLKARPQMA